MDRLIIGLDGEIYLAYLNDPSIEDDWGFYVKVTPAEMLAAARCRLNDDEIIESIEKIQAGT